MSSGTIFTDAWGDCAITISKCLSGEIKFTFHTTKKVYTLLVEKDTAANMAETLKKLADSDA